MKRPETLDRLESFRGELHTAEAEAAKALEERDAAQRRLDKANGSLQAWRTIVAQEEDKCGRTTELRAVLKAVEEGTRKETVALRERAFDGNKTAWVRRAVIQAGTLGITAAELRRNGETAGIDVVGRHFPYVILFKLKKRRLVREEGGRYYPSATN